jgi:glucose-6-phosphate isomerase
MPDSSRRVTSAVRFADVAPGETSNTEPALAWRRLLETPIPSSLRELFASDPDRARRYTFDIDGLHIDLSKHLVDDDVLAALLALADAVDVRGRLDAMMAGEPINVTEDRAVLHLALRAPRSTSIYSDGRDVVPEVHEVLAQVSNFASAVRSGAVRGATGERFDHVVNIGIGGSDLGPAMAYEALRSAALPGLRVSFVSNIDPADIVGALEHADPAKTLFIVSSKTFTTLETTTNARTARAWLVAALGDDAVADHFVAVSTNGEAVGTFGIRPDRTFGFWDWVGGRYSLDSAIGLALVIAIGPDHFAEMLAGMRAVDEHVLASRSARNVALLMALFGVWYTNVLGADTKAVIPYSHELRRFPAYLQQLDMESNGKSVAIDGTPLHRASGPVVWGEPGTNGQHAFFQLLHQGTRIVPVDFIGFAQPTSGPIHHQRLLVANMLAQAEALAFGKTLDEVLADGVPPDIAPHRVFPGGRPTTVIAAERLTPFVLGQLVALYEHVVMAQGWIWGINSFDQWGVELGKVLATRIAAQLERGPDGRSDGAEAVEGHDPSTAGLISWFARHGLGRSSLEDEPLPRPDGGIGA